MLRIASQLVDGAPINIAYLGTWQLGKVRGVNLTPAIAA